MLQEIRVIQNDIGTTILYITHDQEAALQLCDKMAIMDYEGNLCQLGADEDIILRPANRFVFEFIGVSNFLSLVQQNGRAYIDVGEKYPLDDCPMDIFAGGQKMEMGVRSNDIAFDNTSPIRAKVRSSVFLGSEYNYFIQLGNRDLRVQQNALDVIQHGEVKEGQEVGLRFLQPRYYPAKEQKGGNA
jgi:iron(III) transport system ATP-binding protein